MREQAAALVRDRAPYAERLPLLRARAGFLSLTLRDSELSRMLWEERRRAAGALDPVRPGQRLNLSPTPWLWEGLVMPACLVLVVALPKVGKTALMLGWIAAWHHGCQTFLDRPLIGPCPPVLVVGTDQPEGDWARMLQRAGLVDESAQLGAPFLGLFHKGAPLHLDPEGVDRIARYAEDHPGLVILLDSIAACTGPLGIDENSREIADPIRDLMEAVAPYRATVIAIHHANKGRAGDSATVASRGSTALPAEASQIISLSRMPTPEGHPESDQIILRTEGRGGRSLRLLIEQTEHGWICHGEDGVIEERQRLQQTARDLNSRQRAALLALCERWRNGYQPTEAKALTEAIGLEGEGERSAERKARAVLDQLEKDGLATYRLETGEGARRKLYAPTPAGLQAADLLPAPPSPWETSGEGWEGWEGCTDRGEATLPTPTGPEEQEYESPERQADTARERRIKANPAAAEQADADRLWEQQHARRTAGQPDPFTPEAASLFNPGDPVEVWIDALKEWRGGWTVAGPPDAEGRLPLRDANGRRQHVRARHLRHPEGQQQAA